MASIRKLPNGRYQAQYRPVPGGKQLTKTTTRKIDAQRWLDEQTASVVTGQFVDPHAGKVSLVDYFERWADRQLWTPGTCRAMRLAVEGATFRDLPINRIQRSHVEAWIKHMQTVPRGENRAGLAAGTIRTRFNNVRSVFRAATRDRLIPADPTVGVRLPRGRRADAALRLPSFSEVAALRAAAEPAFRAFLAVCAFGGLRLGEAAALRAHDVDLAEGALHVARQVQRAGGGDVDIRAPKYGSERVVFLPSAVVRVLREHLAEHTNGSSPDRWLFEGEGGNPLHQNSIGYWWRRTKNAAGVTDVRLHDLRHFYASGLIAAGCDVVTVQRALGHSSATVTLNTYAHLWPSAEDRTRDAASRLFADTFGQSDE